MRWDEKKVVNPKHGESRTVKRFLWFPLTLDGETRWLEFANIVQRYSGVRWDMNNKIQVGSCEWFNSKWESEK